jgi:serine/threonine protein kinase
MPTRSDRAGIGAQSTTPTPVTGGLHAPALTPGPVVQACVTLGRYQLLSRLAVGGMAEVYLARQGELSGFKTLVVVKKVLPHLAVNPDFVAMFLDEARIASMLNHPNVVRITEVGRAADQYFLAMELVQGMPLTSLLKHGEKTKTLLPHNLSALIVANTAAGLHHAHQLTDAAGNLLGLAHRDVSPQNIMISFEGSVKVIDFGIARALGRLGDTNSGSLKGKLGYMAPEQARGEPVDARGDIFSLGVVLWECLAGHRLFLRQNELATLRAVVYEPIPSIVEHADVDPALRAIVERSLARDVEERFQTAEEVRVALERWVFASGGASTHDLATLMKAWFPSDYQQWQRASLFALDMQDSDTPIDVEFPDLAASNSGHSRTGTSGPDGARSASPGSASKIRGDASSRSFKPPALAPTPAVTPTNLSKTWRRALVPGGVVLATLAGVLWFGVHAGRRQAPDQAGTGTPSLVRPMVETLPLPAQANAGSKSGKTDETVTGAPHVGDAPHLMAQSGDSAGKPKNHASSGEKRAILSPQDVGSHRGKNLAGEKPGRTKKSAPRPNPF